jgi:hypothetical protein
MFERRMGDITDAFYIRGALARPGGVGRPLESTAGSCGEALHTARLERRRRAHRTSRRRRHKPSHYAAVAVGHTSGALICPAWVGPQAGGGTGNARDTMRQWRYLCAHHDQLPPARPWAARTPSGATMGAPRRAHERAGGAGLGPGGRRPRKG